MKLLGFAVSMIAGLVAIGAGIYLLVQQGPSGDSWFEVIAHGAGVFFISCGLFMIGSSIVAGASRDT
jgi:hypothetical protein